MDCVWQEAEEEKRNESIRDQLKIWGHVYENRLQIYYNYLKKKKASNKCTNIHLNRNGAALYFLLRLKWKRKRNSSLFKVWRNEKDFILGEETTRS